MKMPFQTQPIGAWFLLPHPPFQVTERPEKLMFETHKISTEPRHLYCHPSDPRNIYFLQKNKNNNNKKYTTPNAVQTLTLEGISNTALGRRESRW